MCDAFVGTFMLSSGFGKRLPCLLNWWCSAQRNNVVVYFIMNKAFVWGARTLNGGPESRSSFELPGQRLHRTDAPFRIHLVPHTGCPSHLSFWLSSISFKGLAGTIGHLEAFMSRKTNMFLSSLFILGEEPHTGWRLPLFSVTPCHGKEQQLNPYSKSNWQEKTL